MKGKKNMQNGVSLMTKEQNLEIKYGLIDFGVESEFAKSKVKYILTDLNDIRQNYLRLGFHLSEFIHGEYYKSFGYSNVDDFSKDNFGLDKSAISRCINVFRAFCARNADNTCLMYLDERYENYSYSQLTEMLSLDEKQRLKVKPDMTNREIRELKKKTSENSPVATSQLDNIVEKPVKTELVEKINPYISFSDKQFIDDFLLYAKNFVFNNQICNIVDFTLTDKRFTFKDENDTVYNITFSVSKSK